MPIPTPRTGEDRNAFIGRCMEAIGGEFSDNNQAVAVCHSAWSNRNMTPNEKLLVEAKVCNKTIQEIISSLKLDD